MAPKMAFALDSESLGDYFVLINVENRCCNKVHLLEPFVIAAIGGNAKTTGFHLVNKCFLEFRGYGASDMHKALVFPQAHAFKILKSEKYFLNKCLKWFMVYGLWLQFMFSQETSHFIFGGINEFIRV